MGTVVTIKGADFSKTGLGTIDNPNTGGVDADAAAYFVIADTLSEVEKSAVNVMVKSLKSAGLWDKISGLYPFLGTGQTSRGANLRDTAKNLTYVGYNATSEDVKGWKGVAGMYAKTGIASNWNNDFIYCFVSTQAGAQHAFMHCDNISNSFAAIIRQSAGNLVAGANGVWMDFAAGITGSFLASYNNGSLNMFASGTKTTATYSTTSVQSNMQIMAYTNGNAIPVGQIIGISAMGSYLTDTEATDFNSIVDSFLSSVSRK